MPITAIDVSVYSNHQKGQNRVRDMVQSTCVLAHPKASVTADF